MQLVVYCNAFVGASCKLSALTGASLDKLLITESLLFPVVPVFQPVPL